MNPIISAILALIEAAPKAIAEIEALWNQIKSGLGAQDQAVVDTVLAVLGPKLDGDLAGLARDATSQ